MPRRHLINAPKMDWHSTLRFLQQVVSPALGCLSSHRAGACPHTALLSLSIMLCLALYSPIDGPIVDHRIL